MFKKDRETFLVPCSSSRFGLGSVVVVGPRENQYQDVDWTDAWSKREPGDEWRTSHWETSSWCSSHWETSGWNKTDECSDGREGQQWSNHSFFEILNVGLKSIQVSRSQTQLHRVESLTFVHFERPKRLSSTSLGCHPWRQPGSGHWRQSQGVGKGGDALQHERR